MATFVCSMNVSLDGYVDHRAFMPDAPLFQYWTNQLREASASVYGRKIYEIMRYWETAQPEWDDADRAFADEWVAKPKWVVSRTLTDVGPNTTLVSGDVEGVLRKVRNDVPGEVAVSGTVLVQSLGELGMIDAYRLHYHPVVLGGGKPFFAGAVPRLRFQGSDRITDDVVRLTYLPG
ncbi:dihydrofolate reductase family protein [Tabrizicola sp. BL-A-41-H6]|uniref:dihydrofolate reductase family protein n=1 Tax=Tabrizicola sp. BL-A-41-H6 TaxID=3421107 RepID=UPI003D6790E9